MKCLNIIVFYDNEQEVKKYISELVDIASNQVDVALIVNKDTKKIVNNLVLEFKDSGFNNIVVYDSDKNLGYLNAMLKNLKNIDLSQYKYIILSNTDIHYKTKDFFRILLSRQYDSNIGCIAPSVFATRSGSYSNPHYLTRVPKNKFKKLRFVFSFPALARIYLWLAEKKSYWRKSYKRESCYVYSPHGCYMIFTAGFIRDIYGYKYGVKMYSEESCIGELLRKHRKKCFYDSELELEHQESTVTGKLNYKKRFSEWKKSIDYVLKTFYD